MKLCDAAQYLAGHRIRRGKPRESVNLPPDQCPATAGERPSEGGIVASGVRIPAAETDEPAEAAIASPAKYNTQSERRATVEPGKSQFDFQLDVP